MLIINAKTFPPEFVIQYTLTIHALPVEILLIIFEMMYAMCQEVVSNGSEADLDPCLCFLIPDKSCPCQNRVANTTWGEWADLKAPSLFPYALASVCSLWDDLMKSVPRFWTRIVVFIDDPNLALRLSTYLKLTGNLPIHSINLKKRQNAESTGDSQEKAKISVAAAIIRPYLSRCGKLEVEAHSGESLPSLMGDFYGVSNDLKEIHFSSTRRGFTKRHVISPLRPSDPFHSPNLTHLSLTGAAFGELFRSQLWKNSLLDGFKLESFALSHLRPEDGGIWPFDMSTILVLVLGSISTCMLKLSDIRVPRISEYGIRLAQSQLTNVEFTVNNLVMEDVPSDLINSFFMFFNRGGINLLQQTFINCPLHNCPNISTSMNFNLMDISDPKTLIAAFRTVNAWRLVLNNCSALNDEVLSILATEKPDGKLFIPRLSDLTIHDCPNFSIATLRHVVRTRKQYALAKGITLETVQGDEVPGIVDLALTGSCPTISPEDREGLDEELVNSKALMKKISSQLEAILKTMPGT